MLRAASFIGLLAFAGTVQMAAGWLSAQVVSQLRTGDSVDVDMPAGDWIGFLEPLKCDGSGNVYFRPGIPRDTLGAPAIRISARQKTVLFDFRTIPEWQKEKFSVVDFEPATGGDLYYLGPLRRGPIVSRFRQSGEYEGSVILGRQFQPAKLVVTSSRLLIVTGKDLKTNAPFTGLFGADGRFLASIELAEDPANVKERDQSGPAISLTSIVAAADGYVYLKRGGESNKVYVLSPGGELVRSFQIEPPGEGFQSGDLKVSGSRLIMPFRKQVDDRHLRQTRFCAKFAFF